MILRGHNCVTINCNCGCGCTFHFTPLDDEIYIQVVNSNTSFKLTNLGYYTKEYFKRIFNKLVGKKTIIDGACIRVSEIDDFLNAMDSLVIKQATIKEKNQSTLLVDTKGVDFGNQDDTWELCLVGKESLKQLILNDRFNSYEIVWDYATFERFKKYCRNKLK